MAPVELVFPGGGVNRRLAYQRQPPFTTPDSMNVWPQDTLGQRTRGGARAGLDRAYYSPLEQISSRGSPVRLLNTVRRVKADSFEFFEDNFENTTGASSWVSASSIGWVTDAALSYQDGLAKNSTLDTWGGTVWTEAMPLDAAEDYEAGIFVVPDGSANVGAYQVGVRADANATLGAAPTRAVVAEVNLVAGSGTLKVYNAAGTVLENYALTVSPSNEPGWLRVLVSGNDVTVTFRDSELIAGQTLSTAAAGNYVGFGLKPTVSGGTCKIDAFRCQYTKSSAKASNRNILVASSGGLLFYETFMGTLTELSTSLTLAQDRPLLSVDRLQKLYIADTGDPVASGTDGVRGTANNKLDSATYSDWTTLGIDTDDMLLEITNSSDPDVLLEGVYAIGSVASGEVTTSTDFCTGATAATCSFRILRCPKVFDPSTATLAKWTSSNGGSIPMGCPLVCAFRGRVLQAGDPNAPHAVFASRVDDPLDHDYGADEEDPARAWAMVLEEEGQLGDVVTALIPHTDDYLIIGCRSEIWMLAGDITENGRLKKVADVGVVGAQSWCRGPKGEAYILTTDGLYVVAPGSGQLAPISRERLPEELRAVNPVLNTVLMGYDDNTLGVHIYFSSIYAENGTHWFYDLAGGGFWPFSLYYSTSYNNTHIPTAVLRREGDSPLESGLLLGCRDSYIRRFWDFMATDETQAITSYLFIGPLRLGGSEFREGRLQQLIGSLSELSGSVTWSVHVGPTPEAAFEASAFASGTWSVSTGERKGLNFKTRPRARGSAAFVKVSGSSSRWAFERVLAVLQRAGLERISA